jgi:GH15 family glucan-1,4-alpha-glucosidase
VPVAVEAGVVRGQEVLHAGQRRRITLQHGRGAIDGSADADLTCTVSQWRRWSDASRYRGAHAEQVRRSAITLKLLTYAPTGAVVAAPTTSLPESPGGARNWDYRYSWVRDSALAVRALVDLGYHDDAMQYWAFMEKLGLDRGVGMHIAHAIDGSAVRAEEDVEALCGWRGSRPVRVGNAAAPQRQLDVPGYVLDAAEACQAAMGTPHEELAPHLSALADHVCSRWRDADQGIWELRLEPQQLVHSKLMCWVALDRALKLERRGIIRGNRGAWQSTAAEIRAFVLERGYDRELGSFVQAVGSRHLDASALRIGVLGLLDPRDERFVSTVRAVRSRLAQDGLVRRYAAPDGLADGEGTFTLASFWLIEALAAIGDDESASASFERLVARANDVGLLSEQVDADSGEQLGNYPQAFSHLGLIRAALVLDRGAAAPET